jgi:hypothetical protein
VGSDSGVPRRSAGESTRLHTGGTAGALTRVARRCGARGLVPAYTILSDGRGLHFSAELTP